MKSVVSFATCCTRRLMYGWGTSMDFLCVCSILGLRGTAVVNCACVDMHISVTFPAHLCHSVEFPS